MKFLCRRSQLLTTEQQSGYQVRFELNRQEAEEVCENTAERAFPIQVGHETIIRPRH